MGEVVNIGANGDYDITYVYDKETIVAVTHPDWPFRIMRKDGQIALVCEDTDEPFGELDRDVFNMILMCWLLVDDPDLIDQAAK